jgi:hypothetical protein
VWIYFIGRNKLNLTTKEIGRLKFRLFLKLYQYYKDDFDKEMIMKASNTTYKKLKEKAEESDKYF